MQACLLNRICLLVPFLLLAVSGAAGGRIHDTAVSTPEALRQNACFDATRRVLQDTATVSNNSSLPTRIAHFPLSGNFVGKSNVSTTVYNGMGSNHTWEIDPDAGTVLECSKAKGSRVELPTVPYGHQGPWAINFWFKPTDESGSQYQYLFSHNSTQFSNYTANPYNANQIRLYFPETGHPAYGILRAIVKDSNNTNNITSYLDSDGQVANDYESDADSTPYRRQFLADGLWHMVTLSTLTSNASGLRGFAMLLDGRLVGIEAADTLYISSETSSAFPGTDGGRPMMLDGKMVLCSHSDPTFNRHYNGGIAQLSIYDSALQPAEVRALYNQGVRGSGTGSLLDAFNVPSQSSVKRKGIVQAWPELPPNSSLTPQQIALQSLPPPDALFPLSDGSVRSDPWLDQGYVYQGGSLNATFVEDPDTFGRTLQCNKGAGSIVWLPPALGYQQGGNSSWVSFTVNLWFKAGNTTGELFQYLFSQSGDPDGNEWDPNQVSIYFPEQQHPRYGVVRAVVKDTSSKSNSSSTSGQMVYLDSDDLVANNVNTPILDGANPMADGKWHMVTVTTQPDMSTGFLLFLDGIEVGNMLQGSYTGSNGTINATGGAPMNLSTPITLCQRADAVLNRGFDGRLSSLGIWTSVLPPANISALFAYGLSAVPYIGNTTNLTMSQNSTSVLPTPMPAVPPPAVQNNTGILTGNPAAAPSQRDSNSRLGGGAVAGIVVGALAACVLGAALAFLLFRRRRSSPAGTFHTFQDEAGAYPASFPVSSTAAEPNARVLSTQDSSKNFLHKFSMPN